MAILAADTDKINSQRLRDALLMAQNLKIHYDDSIQANMPPGEIRSSNDQDVMKFLKNQIETVTALLDATVRLCGSDIPPTDDIKQAFEFVEELNSGNDNGNGNGNGNGGGRNPRHT
jgi:hypothetical protein